MNCPKCQTAMTIGIADFGVGFIGYFQMGVLSPTVTFREPGGKEKTAVDIGDRRAAYECPACGGLFIAPRSEPIPPDPGDPTECGQCGITLKPGRTDCHFCGWQKQTKPADQ